MITVRVDHDGEELALIRIHHLWGYRYYAEFVFDKLRGNTGIVRKSFNHSTLEHNVLSLVKDALSELDPHHLEFEGGPASPSDLARGFRRVVPAIQGWARQLRNN